MYNMSLSIQVQPICFHNLRFSTAATITATDDENNRNHFLQLFIIQPETARNQERLTALEFLFLITGYCAQPSSLLGMYRTSYNSLHLPDFFLIPLFSCLFVTDQSNFQ